MARDDLGAAPQLDLALEDHYPITLDRGRGRLLVTDAAGVQGEGYTVLDALIALGRKHGLEVNKYGRLCPTGQRGTQ